MAYCKYHPLAAATFSCPRCGISHCDQCAGDVDKYHNTLCHRCHRPMQSLGTAGSSDPFWRRLPEAFRYPLNANALPIIIGIAIITTLLTAVPFLALFSIILYLTLTGALFKYAFRCLECTSAGEMEAPSTGDAFEGGLALLLKLIVIMVCLGAAVALASAFLPSSIAGLVGTLVTISLPAILIRFAQSEEILDALNPLHVFQLILTIGLPYGVLMAFIMIMMGSVGVINALIGSHWSVISHALQAIVSNYYTVVVFHIMGYMLYQYQDKLGYTARATDQDTARSEVERLLAKIDVSVKEGEYNQALDLFETGIREYPQNKTLAHNFFDFAFNTKRKDLLKQSAGHYLDLLAQNHTYDKLNAVFTTANRLCPGIMPRDPLARLQLAKSCRTKGDPSSAVKLLKGLHKTHPQFAQLDEAYQLLALALEDLNMPAQAEKCRALAKRMETQNPRPKPVAAAERFTARDITPAPASQPPPSDIPGSSARDEPRDLPPIEFK